MYRVLCDSFLLYDDSLEEYKIFSPKVDLELNKTGSFTFTIYPDHPTYEFIRKMKSIITVYQDDFLLFRGRVLNDEIGFYNEKYVECEGEMAFLIDSVIRPYEFTGSITEFLQKLISEHNAQVDADRQFTLGNVTVTDAEGTVSMTANDYKKTLEVITESLVNRYGGYVDIRRQGNVSYIDYLNDFTLLSPQKIEFAKNLLDMKRIRKGEEISTALIPLGAKLEGSEERLTIESVNDGLDYIFDEDAVKEYGMIFATNIWDDVTIASNLLRKAKAHLASLVNTPETIELSAADLASVDKTVTSYHVGTYVNVTSNPHGINQNLLVRKLSIDLLEPAANKLVLGGIVESFTAKTVSAFNVTVRDGKDGKDAAVLRIDSSRGTVFKNNQITTTLSVVIYFGENRITNKAELTESFGASAYLEWSWQRMDESTFGVISASDSRIRDHGFSLDLTPADVDTKATFMCKLII